MKYIFIKNDFIFNVALCFMKLNTLILNFMQTIFVEKIIKKGTR